MSLSEVLSKACDAEVPGCYWNDVQQVVRLRRPDGRFAVIGSGIDGSHASTPPEYVPGPEVKVSFQLPRKSGSLKGVALDTGTSPLGASRDAASARILPHPNRRDTGVLGFLAEAEGGEDSLPSQESNQQKRDTPELSRREKESRQPPNPFDLLDVDPTRPELPSRLRIVPVIRIGELNNGRR